MNKFITILFVMGVCLFRCLAHAQTEPFKIPLPYNKTPNSLYKTTRLLDMRSDTTEFGYVQKGALNKRVSIIANPSLEL